MMTCVKELIIVITLTMAVDWETSLDVQAALILLHPDTCFMLWGIGLLLHPTISFLSFPLPSPLPSQVNVKLSFTSITVYFVLSLVMTNPEGRRFGGVMQGCGNLPLALPHLPGIPASSHLRSSLRMRGLIPHQSHFLGTWSLFLECPR